MSLTRLPLRGLGTAALLVAAIGLAPSAGAEETPPDASSGVAEETWGAPVSNDLFTVTASSWKGLAGLGSTTATIGSVTVTATQDVTMEMTGTYTDPDTLVGHRVGVCPQSVDDPTIAMSAGDTCQLWFTYGPGAMDTIHTEDSTVNMTATTAEGQTADAAYNQSLIVLPVHVTGALDFGDVAVGTTARRTFAITDISTDPVEVDLTALDDGGQFGMAPDQPTTLTLDPGQSTDVAVAFSPTTLGPDSVWSWQLHTHAVGETKDIRLSAPTLRGTGVPRELHLTADPVDFGSVTQDETATQPLAITNTGPLPLHVTSATVDTAAADDLTVSVPDTLVEPGDSVTGTVTWSAHTDLTSVPLTLTAEEAGVTDPEQAAAPVTVEDTVSGLVAEPADPAGPVDPVNPVDPATPSTPAAPVTPTGPSAPQAATTHHTVHTTAAPHRLARTGSTGLVAGGLTALAALGAGAVLLLAGRRRTRG